MSAAASARTGKQSPARPRVEAARRGRNAMIAKLHLARRDLALEEESYRNLLERETGRRSAAEMSDKQLETALAAFERLGFKPKRSRKASPRPHVWKLQALWRSLWLLGEVEHLEGLDAFVERQTGLAAARFLGPAEAASAIEALKDWCARAGFEVPQVRDGGRLAKEELVQALHRRLHAGRPTPPLPDLRGESSRQLDRMAETLGARLREAKAAKEEGE